MIFVVSTKSYFVILILEKKFISIISTSLRQFTHFVFFCDLFVAVVAAGPDFTWPYVKDSNRKGHKIDI